MYWVRSVHVALVSSEPVGVVQCWEALLLTLTFHVTSLHYYLLREHTC